MSDVDVTYNPFQPGFSDNPYPHYREMRDSDPVHHSPMGVWVLFRYDDVFRVLRDPSQSVEDRKANPTPMMELARQVMGDVAEAGSNAMLNRDPPDHTRLRRLVSKAFTPRMVERLRPRVEQLVDEALAAAGPDWDVIDGLAFPLPFQVISELLGTPETDTTQLREWSGTLVRSLEPVADPDLLAAIAEASRNIRGLIGEIIDWKRRNPADDLLSGLIAAEDDGDTLSEDELAEQVALLYLAGHETTVNLIGNGTLALLAHRSQLDRLRSDPDLDANAVEELLRFDSPVQMSRRIPLEPLVVGGKEIEAGAVVILGLGSSNRDPSRWGPTAEELDLTRPGASQHVSFGGGHHYCLGSHLARLEAQVAIGRLVRGFPGMELGGEPAWNGRINLRGLARLPVRTGR
ncbi:MAG TPA: cytochrome P450 [Acidimicrobiales bacterium]|nr:cytochrome P450 [Acidimicrobiales bacterium]